MGTLEVAAPPATTSKGPSNRHRRGALLVLGSVVVVLTITIGLFMTAASSTLDGANSLSTPLSAAAMAHWQERLRPRDFVTHPDGTLARQQFVHLHHMKTGGTSMDSLIHCGMSRLQKQQSKSSTMSIPYANLHECSPMRYQSCLSQRDQRCWDQVANSSILSYCAPLKDLPTFTWNKEQTSVSLDNNAATEMSSSSSFDALTVLRHPVGRVWSMYRFQTKACYQCKSLQRIYQEIDDGVFEQHEGSVCQEQLTNHQTRNLLTSNVTMDDPTLSEDDLVALAVADLQDFFTVIGLTEDMTATHQIVGRVFPWLAETLPDSDTTCPMPHANASPRNNYCGPNNTHMELPDHPDAETEALIRKHNALDLRVYEEALKIFDAQKQALGIE